MKHNKPLIFLFASVMLAFTSLKAQNGLEAIIVETFYISSVADQSVNDVGGLLPNESVTYRVFVDMLPNYRLQAIYGVPGHELRIATTSLFFNNEDRGATSPTYTKLQARNNTVMLDSWLSVGAACAGQLGILKLEDDGVATVINSDGVLQNANTASGIAISIQDGMFAGTPEAVTTIGLDNIIGIFDNQNDGTNGPVFSTEDGAWAALSGATGPIPETNKVLIGQFTTNGVFSFKLNLQLGTPDGGVEQYVAESQIGDEILFSDLNFMSDVVTKNSSLQIQKDQFTISPNPVSNTLYVKINSKSKMASRISIYNMQGQVVSTNTMTSLAESETIMIDLSESSQGAYIVELIQDGVRSTKRFVKN